MAWIEWINDSNVNAHTAPSSTDLPLDVGFESGNIISAIQVNSIIRQANIITVALMKALGVDGDYKSSIGDATTGLQKSILDKIKTVKVNNAGQADLALNCSGNSATANTAGKVGHTLSFTSKTFDGSADTTIGFNDVINAEWSSVQSLGLSDQNTFMFIKFTFAGSVYDAGLIYFEDRTQTVYFYGGNLRIKGTSAPLGTATLQMKVNEDWQDISPFQIRKFK